MSDFYSSKKIKKTRKSHTCFGCCKKIPTGSEAMVESGVFDGEFNCNYFCKNCSDYLDKYFEPVNGDIYEQGFIDEDKEYNEKWLKEQDNGVIGESEE